MYSWREVVKKKKMIIENAELQTRLLTLIFHTDFKVLVGKNFWQKLVAGLSLPPVKIERKKDR